MKVCFVARGNGEGYKEERGGTKPLQGGIQTPQRRRRHPARDSNFGHKKVTIDGQVVPVA